MTHYISMPSASVQATTHSSPSLLEQLQALPPSDPEESRRSVLECTAAWRSDRLKALHTRFEQEGDTARLLKGLTAVMDEAVTALARLQMPGDHGMAVVATGGYGRCEQFLFSDVDLLFLYRPAARGAAERVARTMLYVLWDLNIKVGHALRSVEETLHQAEGDIIVRTGLLDARLIVGDGSLYEEMIQRFQAEIVADSVESFVELKLQERDERHKRLGDSRYLLEPNIKEGKGGLRDVHTLYWIARYAYGVRELSELVTLGHVTPEEYGAFEKAKHFLWKLRAHLHDAAGKAEERLTFDRQQVLAPRLGYEDRPGALAVEQMMKRYFMAAREVGRFTRIVCALLEERHMRKPRQPLAVRLDMAEHLEGFILDGERLSVAGEDEFARAPARMLELFRVAQQHGYDIHPRTLQWVARNLPRIDRALRRDAHANALFLDILLSEQGPEQTLRRMNEVGLLGRFIPEFGRIVGQMQFNLYHVYTVDEHTIVALGNLHALWRGELSEEMPLATDAIRRIQSRRVLYLALLCHDIAKGRGSDHSEGGARIAHRLARRFGFDAQEVDLCAWLVRHHLLLTHIAFKRDPADLQSLRDFVDTVRTLERLRLLLVLTAADMRAVGPGIWNAWKATLLRGLYQRAELFMRTGRIDTGESTAELRARLQALLPAWPSEEVEAYLALGDTEYHVGLAPEAHARVAGMLKRCEGVEQSLVLDAQYDAARGIATLTVVVPDQHALFSRLAGAISLNGGDIAGARIFTLKNGIAVDVFQMHAPQGDPFDQPEKLARMSLRMRQAVAGKIDIGRELARQKPAYASRRDTFQVAGQVFIENEASGTHTIIEVVGRDRVGFLHAVTHALSEQGAMIGSAHISTYGPQAVDVFYVKDLFGMKITHEKKLTQLREALLAAVEG